MQETATKGSELVSGTETFPSLTHWPSDSNNRKKMQSAIERLMAQGGTNPRSEVYREAAGFIRPKPQNNEQEIFSCRVQRDSLERESDAEPGITMFLLVFMTFPPGYVPQVVDEPEEQPERPMLDDVNAGSYD